jgi:formylglycine-generating enzyme required for sulfatase activity
MLTAVTAASAAAPLRIGFVAETTDAAALAPEARAAWTLASRLGQASLVRPQGDALVDAAGKPAGQGALDVLWLHAGDGVDLGPLEGAACVTALKTHAQAGGGVLLSGAALALVKPMGIEPRVPRRGKPGADRVRAGVRPAEVGHPAYRGVSLDGDAAPMTDAGYPAFADFHGSGGPAGGMVIGRASPDSSENPLVEYECGKGRVIALGWRLPHYANAANAFRANLERLTGNLLAYLAAPDGWQKVVVAKGPIAPAPARAADAVTDASWEALRLAVDDLVRTFGERYPRGEAYLAQLAALRKEWTAADGAARDAVAARFKALQREALLANPLVDIDRLLVVKRGVNSPRLGLPANWESNSSLPHTGYDDEIAVMSDLRGKPRLATLYRPDGGRFVGDVDLDWDAWRMLFSMPAAGGRWQVHEIAADGSGLRQLPLITERDVDNYDACYLPDGRIMFTSTAPFVGVPCVTGSSHVSNIYLYDPANGGIRRLTFEQDHDWCPTVLPNGRVLYLRWEYSDIPHFVSRILFHMNPDGTEQMEFYGSNSYWPNSVFYARPVPGSSTRFVGVVSGHHDTARLGELVLFDAAAGKREAAGAVQRIPGRGKPVVPVILDGLVGGRPPRFLHPWPLSDKHFLVSSNAAGGPEWGVYLADVFDNLVLIASEPGYALLEPVPLAPRPRPPAVPDKADPTRTDALVYMTDVYAGPGLKDVPRGTVKRLRLVSYQFAYHGMGGQVNRVGLDGPWDVKRIIGTVPVEADGSAYFRVPANTPISVQPLDEKGRALQLMRSWMTAMPGEVLACVGCHESQGTVPASHAAPVAGRRAPSEIAPWYGPARGFAFKREVQPVLEAACTRCHDGRPRPDGLTLPDFTARAEVHPGGTDKTYTTGTRFSPSYMALRAYVRGHTIESDIHLLEPGEFHADTTELVQRLAKGHHGVRLTDEAWDRLATWIDLNTPYHGSWREIVGEAKVANQRSRRLAMDRRYAAIEADPEADADLPAAALREAVEVVPEPPRAAPPAVSVAGWPFDAAEAGRRQAAAGPPVRTVDLGDGVTLDLVRIPAGEFVMGSAAGDADEGPPAVVRIARPFWMGRCEVTNAQFARFDPAHDSRLEHGDFLQFSVQERGYPVNGPDQPVCRVTWRQAMAFCAWLSEKAGLRASLPTEAQWEYACRAGTAAPLWYGDAGADFAALGNMADARLRRVDTFGWNLPSGAIQPWRPAAEGVDDGARVSRAVGAYRPNPWGLCDVHGNVAEWTRTASRPYPYAADGRDDPAADGGRVVRGGSWYDMPQRCRSSSRRAYPPWRRVFDVGFRVMAEEAGGAAVAAGTPR